MVHWTSSQTIKQTFRHTHRCVHIQRERDDETQTCTQSQTYRYQDRDDHQETERMAERRRGETGMQTCKRDQQTDRHTRCTSWDRSMYINTCMCIIVHVRICAFTAYSSIRSISPSYYIVSICRSSIPFHNGHSNTTITRWLCHIVRILYGYHELLRVHLLHATYIHMTRSPNGLQKPTDTCTVETWHVLVCTCISLYYSKCNNNCVIR